MPHEILFSLNIKYKKDEHTRIERNDIWKRSKGNRVSCLNIYILVVAFLSNTVEGDRW